MASRAQCLRVRVRVRVTAIMTLSGSSGPMASLRKGASTVKAGMQVPATATGRRVPLTRSLEEGDTVSTI